MKLADQVQCAIEDAGAGKFDSAQLHSCIAIDTTSRRLNPAEKKVGVRYIQCLRGYYWIIEPMIGAGLNLVDTKFSNISLRNTSTPDLAEIIYEILRCSHACENAMAGGGGASEKVSQKFCSHQAILSERSYTGTRLPALVEAK